jgi:tetrahydromethanopterin S-methyltransferase subunit E
MISGLIIVVVWVIGNRFLEVWARKSYGPYKKEETA